MSRFFRNAIPGLLPILALLISPAAGAAEAAATQAAPQSSTKATEEAMGLDELLQRIREGWRAERVANEKREAAFRRAHKNQKKLLADAHAELKAQEDRSTRLEKTFQNNEVSITEQEDLLSQKLGSLGELFGVVRQVAGDTRSQVENSVISAQFPNRQAFLDKLGQNKALPSIEKLEKLWFVLQQEMTESSKVVRFRARIVGITGEERDADVTRVGSFNAVADGKYLAWRSDVQKLGEIGRQPEPKYVRTVESLESARSGMVRFAIDPARGQILSLLVRTPNFRERIDYGGYVGYAIIVLGSITLVVGFLRLLYIFAVSRQVASQKKSPQPNSKNPLGRVLQIYADNEQADTETLELKLEEGVIKETARIEGFLWFIKVVSAVAPLMGLLGTVTGMIKTFQIITLFGTGDPKMMASGISEALVTTMLGLIAAIPLVLMHSLLTSMARGVTNILEEQTTGLIALKAEAEGAGKPTVKTAV